MSKPNRDQLRTWRNFYNRLQRKTGPNVRRLILIGELAERMQTDAEQITGDGGAPVFFTANNAIALRNLSLRLKVLDRLLGAVAAKKYAVTIENGRLNIVAHPGTNPEAVQSDIFPPWDQNMGAIPVPVIIAGIAALVLLIAGDQQLDRMEAETKLEERRLQRAIIDGDQKMAGADEETRAKWEKFKKGSLDWFSQQAKKAGVEKIGWIERVLGKGPTIALVAAAAGGIALYAWSKSKAARNEAN